LVIKNSTAFTLLELLVVIIIVGVLASVALPSYWTHVEMARSTEAKAAMGQIRMGLESCVLATGSTSQCAAGPGSMWDNMGIDDPDKAGGHFTYDMDLPAIPTSTDFIIYAYRNTYENGDGSSYMRFCRTGGVLAWCGAGKFTSVGHACPGSGC
jgi:type IV pilus assembly protein PilE